VRLLLGGKIDSIMSAVDLVIAGNAYIADRAAAAGARAVARLPTAVDLGRYPKKPRRREGPEEPFTIGWIGSPLTSPYLEQLRATLTELSAQLPLRVRLIGAASGALAGLPVDIVPWSVETEAAELARCDLGIMPLPDEPWERGKCGYKLIQYMASALPVVASPVGANRDIVASGETGFLAGTSAEWAAAITRLYRQPELRERMGLAGRNRAEHLYSLETTAPRLIEFLSRAAATTVNNPNVRPSDGLFRATATGFQSDSSPGPRQGVEPPP
jgi:glycosyltransferase involved in cell wall biosynthesis